MKKTVFLFVLLVFLISSCGLLFKTPSLPGSFSLKSALLILDGFQYPLTSVVKVNEVYGAKLGNGICGMFENFNGTFYVFKYVSSNVAKSNWKNFRKQVGGPLKINYLTYSWLDRGYFQVKYKSIDIISWWKDNWLFIITGKDAKEFFNYINEVYGEIK
ncbi:hypothetical protein SU69_09670 [Thermosipho melanesiensis]|uniref:Lipoprotein n=2 Tax=Thermosipho melanesiensis TaxID=46541 RepID=A6LP92_THEM4|nr:DUF3242 domain-containing protein [Thermosipho melanesiensis]ABR31743.1 hypothetical protein Tmel_1911 [Thermosipho melanesiensis BI429]APT74765.1 hypothetical protein BW47_10040 [Thermosipho melanesiensis]OOC35084.1 hypothetical protein SU69_09670 [Thermosipho melanesiensis]OOC35120.1 hypothetical protein SU70_09680 [Thermosipho melanesiensis]OOC36728.1 hypothetical protein SU68_09720 [Thermosipho melanesiensis]